MYCFRRKETAFLDLNLVKKKRMKRKRRRREMRNGKRNLVKNTVDKAPTLESTATSG